MTVDEIRQKRTPTFFIKTKSFIEFNDIRIMRKEFIPDSDMPEFPPISDEAPVESYRIYPLSVTEFPGVLSHMTAMQAGAWAVTKCLSVGWELSYDNFNSCLANLEMDY